MKFDQKVLHSLFTGCIPCLLWMLTLSSNHEAEDYPPSLFHIQGVILAVRFFCWTLYSFHVLYSTLQTVILFFICRVYSLQFVFLLELVLRSCGVLHVTEGYPLI